MRLVGAAQSLGASRWRAFVHVFLPLSMPGVRAATLLVLILGLGFYVIPALLGGLRENTLAMLINNQFSETVNWHLGAAMAMVLLMMTLVGIGLYYHSIARTPGKRSS
jgi:ABC-type spermidine/putrescine transport system permease subunit I